MILIFISLTNLSFAHELPSKCHLILNEYKNCLKCTVDSNTCIIPQSVKNCSKQFNIKFTKNKCSLPLFK